METINWHGNISGGGGYTGSAMHLVVGLERLGWDVRVNSTERTPDQNLSEEAKRIYAKPFKKARIGIAYGLPGDFKPLEMNEKRFGFSMFETDKLPEGKNEWNGETGDWTDNLKGLECLITPSLFATDLFKRYQDLVDVETVPLGVDRNEWKYVARPCVQEDEVFTFLMVGTLTIRKNPGYALGAFLDLFMDNPNAQLILKTQDGTLGHITLPHKNVRIIDRRSTIEEIHSLYNQADCFVFPSRGEGFGLPPLEAMASGLPTILSANTGMQDFADPEYCYPIRKMTLKPATHFPKRWGNVGNWLDPDYEELKSLMLHVYQHRAEAYNKGKRASQWVRDTWSYDESARKLSQLIKERS